jgi:hypothetical protein
MESLFFLALAALSLGVAAVPAFAQNISTGVAAATRYQRTGAI